MCYKKISDLKKVMRGRELRKRKTCYHINKIHPNSCTKITLTDIDNYAKSSIVQWIKEGSIWIDK